MWPKLTNIEKEIVNSINSRRNIQKATNMNVWLRVFSGAGSGLIISSNNNFELFKAAGEGASIYGSPNSVGTIGTDWNGTPIFGGNDRALRPSPGIVSFTVKEGKDQISKEANLQIKCFSLQQMETIQKYFLEPGYSLCVEWGWNTPNGGMSMIDTSGKEAGILTQCTERNLNYITLHELRKKSNGDYDTFLGFIVGGSVSNDGEQFNVDVKLRGAPGLPTYLQSHVQLQKQNIETGKIIDSNKHDPYPPSEVSDGAKATVVPIRRFKSMFNDLPAHRQTTQVDDLKTKVSKFDFINIDDVIKNNIVTSYGTNYGIFNSGYGEDITVNAGNGTSITINKEKLYSKHRYIKMDLAIDILNSNGTLLSYKMGDKEVGVGIDISKTKIGAFPNMFSTKASALVIPGTLPDFKQYYFNHGTITQEADGFLIVGGNKIEPNANNAINGVSFVQSSILTKDMDSDGYAEKAGYWGYLKDLYVNFDMLVAKTKQPNKSIREVLLDILNEMSAAVNSFWHFQLVERVLTEASGDLKKGDVVITVIDENWIGENPNESIEFFYHTGARSPFLESTLDLSIPADMANKIISERLSVSSQKDASFISTAKGGFFASEPDKFLQKANTYNEANEGKPAEGGTVDENSIEFKKEKQIKLQEELDTAILNSNAATKAAVSVLYGQENVDAANARRLVETKQNELSKLTNEIAKKVTEEKVAAINSNLNKIEIVPNPEAETITTENANNSLKTDGAFTDSYRVYCFDDKSYFDRLKNDAFQEKGGLSHPLPIKYLFKTLGISGLRRGDTFVIKGIPDKYYKNGLFQITQIEHTLSGMMWTTSVTGEFRAKQSKKVTK
jgi:hypothetical protein